MRFHSLLSNTCPSSRPLHLPGHHPPSSSPVAGCLPARSRSWLTRRILHRTEQSGIGLPAVRGQIELTTQPLSAFFIWNELTQLKIDHGEGKTVIQNMLRTKHFWGTFEYMPRERDWQADFCFNPEKFLSSLYYSIVSKDKWFEENNFSPVSSAQKFYFAKKCKF